VILERFAGMADKFSGVFGMLHEIKAELAKIRERVAPPDAVERFGKPLVIKSWEIAKPSTVPPAYLSSRPVIEEPAELAVLLHEIAVRAETVGMTGRICCIRFQSDNGRLEIYARERLP